MTTRTAALFGALWVLSAAELAAQAPSSATPVLRAARLQGAVAVDGRLDDAAWALAPAASEFTESYPASGTPASERTEVRVLYDDAAVYVGVRMHDARPDSIAAPLARRDAAGIYSDWVHLILDTYHDRRTAFRFSVNPRGVQRDVYVYDDGSEDASWDAVWQVAARVDSLGWTAEYRIPLSQLRLARQGAGGERTWGLQVMRDVARRVQRFSWAPWDQQSPGFVSRFGELRGLAGLGAVRRLEVRPYASARLTRAPAEPGNPLYRASAAGTAVGADLKLGLTPGLTMTAAINPDFGQVELDPAEVNLTAFETFLPEQRPFFVEGADVFRFGQVRTHMSLQDQHFFYSRRIGRTPQRLLGGPDIAYVDAPTETTIHGAVKVTGKAGPWTVGVMDALTGREEGAWVGPDGARGSSGVEPRTNYLLQRVRREFGGGRTVAGAMLTAVHRDMGGDEFDALLRSHAYFGGVDWEHAWAARAWVLSGYVGASRVGGSAEAIALTQRSATRYFQRPDADHVELDPRRTSLTGHIGQVALQHTGAWDLSLGYKESSPGFELNDVGYQGQTDYRNVTALLGRRVTRPGRLFRNHGVYAFAGQQWNFGGDPTLSMLGAGGNGTLTSLWSVGFEGSLLPAAYDDRLTRGGPLARRPAGWDVSGSVGSPARHRLSFSASGGASRSRAGDWRRWMSAGADWRPSAAVRVQVGPTLAWSRGTGQYVTAAADSLAAGTFGARYVFADIDQTTLSARVRLDWTFRPTLSLQLYAQPFIAAGDYGGFKEFRTPRGYAFDVYGRDRGTLCAVDGVYLVAPAAARACPAAVPAGDDPDFTVRFGNPDFNVRSLRGNAVLRWEYRPGSTLFLIWQQERSGFLPEGDLRFSRDVDAVFRQPATHVFMVKATYWFGA